MSDSLQQRSPLIAFQVLAATLPKATRPGVFLTERSFFGHINLRGNPGDSGFLDAVQRCLRIPLPRQPNTVTKGETVSALWLGPDEWLLITPPKTGHEFANDLRDSLQGVFSSVTNVADGQTIFRISGAHVVAVLRKGCSLDFDPRVFGPGCCAQTLIAKVGVLIHCLDQSPCFDLVVRRSFSEYFGYWIQDAAVDYGFAVV
jgi:sarcosine oxidase subunit gamma